MLENEPFYKQYYKRQTSFKKIKLRLNWLKTDIKVLIRHVGYKLKYGLSWDGNPSEKNVE